MSTKDLSRWSGIACILAGFLIVLTTLVHPSRETPDIILEQELRPIVAFFAVVGMFWRREPMIASEVSVTPAS